MCTLTYIPQENGFILTHNRDVDESRPTSIAPSISRIGGIEVMCPKDPKGGGTWTAVSEQGRAVSLLNGAFSNHTPQKNYRKSRGQVLLESFAFSQFKDFVSDYLFTEIEPFTIISSDLFQGKSLQEFRWDGKKKHLLNLDENRMHIWSSATLYSPEIAQLREFWFREWSKAENYKPESILKFHHNGGNGDMDNDLIMRRKNGKCTESICQIISSNKQAIMKYENISRIELSENSMEYNKELYSFNIHES